MKKWKALLSALAAICTLSMFTACGLGSNGSDSGSTDTGSTDIVDTGSTDAGSTDTGSTDTGSTDTGSTDTGSTDTGSSDTGSSDTGSTDTGSTETPVTYTVTFVDEDDTVISTATYESGAIVDEPEAPTKAADNTYTYAFAGWDQKVTTATANVTYKATYTATYIEYTVKFVNDDDSLIAEKTYHYGDTVEAPTATKAADNTYTYTFAGWDTEVVAVAGDATYKATYTSTFIEYTVKFVDDNGAVISEKTDYHYGDDVSVPSDPEKAATEYFTFAFAGWDSEVAQKVAGNATYVAKFDGALKSGINANNVTAGANETIVLGAGNIANGANYTIGQNNGGNVTQSYLALDGNFGFDDYVVFDFTGKNMPEVMFFAKNYNETMYYEAGKQGVVVTSGITLWDGGIGSTQSNNTKVGVSGPFGVYVEAAAEPHGGNMLGDFAANLARANLVDGTQYRVIMGFTKPSDVAFSLKYALYNASTGELVEEIEQTSWNFFTGANAAVGNMTLNDLVGSIVLYGKYGTTCAIDKLYGVFEDTTIANIAGGLNSNKTYTVTFKGADGAELKKVEGVKFGEVVSYDGEMPTPEKTEDALFTYAYGWDKAFGKTTADTVYTLEIKATPKSGINSYKVTTQGESVVLGAGTLGNGANYVGPNANDLVDQAYLGLDGNYGLDNYIVFDFTGKNMPEIAFFAKNYNNSMYYQNGGKEGIVVTSGITNWDGSLKTDILNGSKQVHYTSPNMIENVAHEWYTNSKLTDCKLARANLVDGTHYRVIMGFAPEGSAAIKLVWTLVNLDTQEIIEQQSLATYGFYNGGNHAAGIVGMTQADLKGSIVLYGKFKTTCTIDKLHGVESGAYADIVAKYTKA